MASIMVTGGAGFIGSHLCKALLKNSHRIVVVDNYDNLYDPEIKKQNITEIKHFISRQNKSKDDFKIIIADIRDAKKMDEIFNTEDINMVVHLAAMAGVRSSIEYPLVYSDVNINGTINLLEMCRKHGIDKFIFASSSSVYGNNKKAPFSEDDNVDYPISPYAASKKAGELFCFTYHKLFKIDMACLRFFTVYGPGQRPDLAIHKFTNLIYNQEKIPFYGDGLTQRDYTYIDDIIDGILKSIKWVQENKGAFEIFNLGNSDSISLKEMVETLEKTIGKKANIEKLDLQPGDVQRTCADIKKAKEILGYNPTTTFESGIKKFVDWYIKV